MPTSTRRFELVEGTSNKFWEVWQDGPRVSTRYGRMGSNGQITERTEASDEKATKLYERLIREKVGKGYVEKAAAGRSRPPKSATPVKAAPPKKTAASPKKTPVSPKKAAGRTKRAPLELPELSVPSLLEAAEKSKRALEARVEATLAGAPQPLRAEVPIRGSNPVDWGYNFAFDDGLPSADREALSALFRRFTRVSNERGGFVVMGPASTPEARQVAFNTGIVIELEQLRAQLPPADLKARTARLLEALGRPSTRAWSEVVMLLSTWDEATLPGALETAQRALTSWPDAARAPVDAWETRPELRALSRVHWGELGPLLAGGGLEHVTVLKTQDVEGLVEHQAKLARIRSLDLSGKPGLGDVVLRCTALQGLEQLELQQPTYEKGTARLDLARLLGAPHLKNLKALSLYGFELDAKNLEALAGCEQPLERLRISYAKMTPRLAPLLARLASRRRLVSLDLKYNDLGPKGAEALFAQPSDWSALKVLDLSANEIGDRGAAAIASAELTSLKWLNLSSNANKEQLTAAAAKGFAACSALGALENLNLFGHPIGAEGVAALVGSTALRSLRDLGAAFPGTDAPSLLAACGDTVAPPALEGLNLGHLDAAKKKRGDWSRARFLSQVRTLNLDSLDGGEYQGLLSCPFLGALEVLALGTDYGPRAAESLEALVHCAQPPPRLRYLNLSGVKLTAGQAAALAGSPLGRQLWGLELMPSYTSEEAWRALYDGGLPLVTSTLFESNPGHEFSPLTTWREEVA